MDADARHGARAAELRERLADRLVTARAVRTAGVEAAFRTVPRHLFAPGVSLTEAYANEVTLLRRDAAGVPVSSVSAPDIQAIMLEQAGVAPGMTVLEIGSGGYNAALLAELVGPDGRVVTVDIDPEVTARAAACLAQAGYGQVTVVTADADSGIPEFAPYDRVIVTVETWDIPPAWVDQLTPGGRIVAPVRIRGFTRSLVLDRPPGSGPAGPLLVSRTSVACGFVRMRGAGAQSDTPVLLAGEMELTFDESVPDRSALPAWEAAVRGPRAEVWSDALIWRGEGWDALPLWLAAGFPGFCRLAVNDFQDTGLAAPAVPWATPAVVTANGLAYLTSRPIGEGVVELGTHAFGPDAEALAARFTARVREWDRQYRDGPEPGPEVQVWRRDEAGPPRGSARADLVVEKRHTWLALSWPRRDEGSEDGA